MKAAAAALSALVCFATLAHGAHDLWAATAVYTALALCLAARIGWAAFISAEPGLPIKVLVPIGITAVTLTFSYWGSANPGESRLALLDWFSLMAALWLAASSLRSDESIDWLATGVAWLFPLELAIGLWQRLSHGHFFADQVPGTLVNANIAAAFTLLWIPVLTDRMRREWRTGRIETAFWAGALLCAVGCLLQTLSLWGVLCWAAGVPLTFGGRARFWARRNSGKAAGAALAALALAGAALWWKFTRAYDFQGHALVDPGDKLRLSWWLTGLAMLRESPWLGVGLGNFPSSFAAFKAASGQNTLFAHSLPVEILAETGVLGFAAVAALLAWAFRSADDRRWPFVVGATQFLLYCSISVGAEYLVNLLVLGLFLGAALGPKELSRRRPGPILGLLICGLGVLALPRLWSPFFASRLCVSGRELLEAHSLDEAEKSFLSAAKIDPLTWEASHGLAATASARYSETGRAEELDRALAHERRALALNRHNLALAANVAALEALAKPK
jgi:O-antigen ligase